MPGLSDEPLDGQYKIISLVQGNPFTGITNNCSPNVPVRLNQPDQTWTITRADDSKSPCYLFFIGEVLPRQTKVIGNRSTVTAYTGGPCQKWHVTYRKEQEAYTIEPCDDQTKGWTVPDQSSQPPIVVRKIIQLTEGSNPQYFTSQLFRFQKVGENV